MNFKKTRIAPTPSGFLHLGNALSFMITVCIARLHHSKVLLRIDDLDAPRTKKAYVQDIFDTLDFLEIPYDEGPRSVSDLQNEFSQHRRMDRYNEILNWMASNKKVFACDCSRKKLTVNHPKGWYSGNCIEKGVSLQEKGTNWRLNTAHVHELVLSTYPDQKVSEKIPPSMMHFVVRKKDQTPSYQLASLADDLYFGVDLIVRGQDLWESTLAQRHLSAILPENPFNQSTFYHHPLILQNGKKLSKSDGADAIMTMRKNGLKKEAVYDLIGKFIGAPERVPHLDDFIKFYQGVLLKEQGNSTN